MEVAPQHTQKLKVDWTVGLDSTQKASPPRTPNENKHKVCFFNMQKLFGNKNVTLYTMEEAQTCPWGSSRLFFRE